MRALRELDARAREARGEPAGDELGIEPVAALLQVAAVRHLGDQVRRAEHLPDAPRQVAVDADRFRAALVAGVVHDRGGRVGVAGQPLGPQVPAQVGSPAADVREGVLGAVRMSLVVVTAQVAHVVEQRAQDPHAEQRGRQPRAARTAALVAVHEPRHGERHVEHVLQVVERRVAAVEAGMAALVEPQHVVEAAPEGGFRGARVQAAVQPQDLGAHRRAVRRADAVGDVVIVAAHGW